MKFEDLEVWKRSARLSAEIYKELVGLKDFGFKDQICRSGLSVPSNIAEGIERGSDKEVIRFLTIAKGSCGELRTQTYIGIEIGYIPKQVGIHWIQETKEISAMLMGLIRRRQESGGRVQEDSANYEPAPCSLPPETLSSRETEN
jgi:four helix bundle protein